MWYNGHMNTDRLVFRVHAIQRMFERHITVQEVSRVLAVGEIIEDYPNDKPYPSRLVMGWHGDRPIHIVAADNKENRETIIVTVYEPDSSLWESDFKRRKQ